MSFTPSELVSLAESFEEFVKSNIVKTAKAKKLDPKAKVRSRGKVVFPAESPKVKDKKDHFPINDADQARNALARVGQYDKAPPWYKGTLTELKSAVQRAVHKHYKGIEVTKKKASSYEEFIAKYADSKASDLLDTEVFEDEPTTDGEFSDLDATTSDLGEFYDDTTSPLYDLEGAELKAPLEGSVPEDPVIMPEETEGVEQVEDLLDL